MTDMLWLQIEDLAYYQEEQILKFQEKYQKSTHLICPEEADIVKHLGENILYLAPYNVFKKFKNCIPQIRINSTYGALTTQEKALGLTEANALQQRLGITILSSPYTLGDVGGVKLLKEWTKDYINAEIQGYKAKAIFLVGVPGTGKTFFPKCLAGETNRKLVILNLSEVMEKEEPILALEKIFEYLDNFLDDKFIILIDEIEKMIGNESPEEKRILGAFLTFLNDMHTKASKYKFDALFVATANNLNSILKNNPELLRRGRFDELFFINLPNLDNAKEIFCLYAKVFALQSVFEIMDLETMISIVEDKYQKDNDQAHLFPYTPSEIENLFKRIDFMRKARGELSVEIIEDCIEKIIPIIKSAKEGVNKMVAQKELFLEI
jgi:SpoVK/Ycf46/Vps4 family AAA+-type ATPase